VKSPNEAPDETPLMLIASWKEENFPVETDAIQI
jgi:hypothetical protein